MVLSLFARNHRAAVAFLVTIIFCQIGNVMACPTSRQSAVPHLARFNAIIVAGIGLELLFSLAIVYLPPLGEIFYAAPLDTLHWAMIAAATFVVFAVDALREMMARRSNRESVKAHRVDGRAPSETVT